MDERLPFCFELLDETKIPPIACSSHASIVAGAWIEFGLLLFAVIFRGLGLE
jgi:hypothetical protein